MKLNLTKQDLFNALDDYIRSHLFINYHWFNYQYKLEPITVIVLDLSIKNIAESTFEDIPF